MSKDFNKILENPHSQADFEGMADSIDPNLFLNDATKGEIKAKHNYMHFINLISTGFLSLLTAPFVTTHVSLQLSVLPHKNKYGDAPERDLKALEKLKTEITVQDRRKYELLIKSGVTGTNKPFRAPVYSGYMEVAQGLSKQGVLGFYKGNMIGLGNTWINSFLRFNAFDMLDYSEFSFYHKWNPIAKTFVVAGMCSVIDIICHPIMTMQSRFILQNRLPNFAYYKSVMGFVKKHYKNNAEILQGWRAHIPRNIIMSFAWVNLFKDKPLHGFICSTILSHTLTYPLMTVTRRLQCQSTAPGMIPVRYSGVWHGFKLIMKEEGVKGLYRGFLAYIVAHGFTSSLLVQLNAQAENKYENKFEH